MVIFRGFLLTVAISLSASPYALAGPGTPCELTQCATDTIPLASTGWSNDVTFDKFDPDLGTLTGVSVRLSATIQGEARFESLSLKPAFTTMTFSADCAVFRPGGTDLITSVIPQQQFMQNVGPYDGVTDFGGTSGQTFSNIVQSQTGTHMSPLPVSDLSLFTGTGGGGPVETITLPVTATGTSTGSGAGSIVLQFTQEASVEVEVCYTYLAPGICQTDSIPSAVGPWADEVTFDRFDPDLGILTGIEVTLEAHVQGQIQFESLDAAPSVVTIDYSSQLILSRPGGMSPIAVLAPALFITEFVSAFDGTLDFGGSSGQTIPGIDIVETDVSLSPPPISDLALFTGVGGVGSPGTITLPVTAVFLANGSGPGNLAVVFQNTMAATVDVRYIFDLDCNQNGIPDDQDIANLVSMDFDANGVPDECEGFNSFCNGDTGPTICATCPCGNNPPIGTIGGCINSAATSARLEATGDASVSLPSGDTSDLRFTLSGVPAAAFCILNSGDAVAPGNMANPCFGLNTGAQAVAFDGLRCAITNTRRHGGRSADVNGDVGVTNNPWGGEANPLVGIAQSGSGFTAGQTRFFQVINRDDPLTVCNRGLNTSQAVEVVFTP